jgi:hypothetical protein
VIKNYGPNNAHRLDAYSAGRLAGEGRHVQAAYACRSAYELSTWFEGLGDELEAARYEREHAELAAPVVVILFNVSWKGNT